jgi:hypothetical protein
MDFKRTWTRFAVEAEYDHFGVARIVKAHNEQIATLRSQLAASQERERILREGLEKYADKGNWTSANARSRMKDSWVPGIFGYDIAQATLKAAEEVK